LSRYTSPELRESFLVVAAVSNIDLNVKWLVRGLAKEARKA
jgi:hypothetical protein